MVVFKSTCPKMALWSSWTWGQKNHMGFFLTKTFGKKIQDFL
jgi:hypothetical protein